MVATEIEKLLDKVEATARASSLPETPDGAVVESLLLRAYRQQVMGSV